MIEEVCPVCGAMMGPPVADCPGCHTPHHEDCWRYNGGCAIYGCGASDLPVPAAPSDLVADPDDDADAVPASYVAGLVTGLVGAFYLLQLVLPATLGVPVALGLIYYAWRAMQRRQWAQIEARLLEPPDDREQEALEIKAVLGAVGRGKPHDLAQCYALFEQRRSRARLPLDAQAALAQELAEAGYRVLAAESLEKCLRRQGVAPDPALRALYSSLFLDDPAFYPEAQNEPMGRVLRAPIGVGGLIEDRPQYLLAFSPAGFPREWRRPYSLPGEDDAARAAQTRWIAGPFAPPERDRHLLALAELGYSALPVSPEVFDLPGGFEDVTAVSFTSKGARFVSEGGDFSYPWDEVTTYFFERIQRLETRTRTVERATYGARGSRSSSYVTEKVQEARYDSVLEVHAGAPARRFRIRTPGAELFGYLGRRRELAFVTNLRFAAKDLARFAPAARASRAVVAMFSERQSRETILESPRELEESIQWFAALGHPVIRGWWNGRRPAGDAVQ